jgi:hypothetical protein
MGFFASFVVPVIVGLVVFLFFSWIGIAVTVGFSGNK